MATPIGPTWFLEADVIFDFIFFVTTGIVTLLGFQAYRFFKDEKHKLHSTGFLFLCASYFMLFLSNLYVLLEYREVNISLKEALQIISVSTLGSILHAIFFLVGFTFLIILYFKVEDRAIRWLLIILVLFSVLLADKFRSAFYALVAILLFFIIIKLMQNYKQKKRKNALLVLIGFICIFVGEILMSLIVLTPLMYVAAGIVTLIGYLLIIGGLVVR